MAETFVTSGPAGYLVRYDEGSDVTADVAVYTWTLILTTWVDGERKDVAVTYQTARFLGFGYDEPICNSDCGATGSGSGGGGGLPCDHTVPLLDGGRNTMPLSRLCVELP